MNNLPPYERDGDWYFHKYEFETGSVVRIMAKEIRRERTGVHGALAIERNGKPLAWSNLNLERDEDRTRLVNSAYKGIEQEQVDAQLLTKQALKSAVDGFCFNLFAETLGDVSGEMMAGDEESGRPVTIIGDPAFVVDGGSTLISAPAGKGKSYTGMITAICLDAGLDYLWPVQQRRAGYVNLERSAGSQRYRLATVNKALGLDPRRPLPFLNARGRGLAEIRDGIRRFVEKFELEVLIFDSISRAGLGKLNEDSTANAIMDTMNAASGGTWIGLAHMPRADSSHIFGSVHFENAQDVGVKLTAQRANGGMTLGIGLTVTQANDLPEGGLSVYALDFDRERGLIAIRRSKASEFPELVAGNSMSLPDEIAGYLLNLPSGRDAAPDIAAAIGQDRGNVSRVLNRDDRFVNLGKAGKKTVYGVRQA